MFRSTLSGLTARFIVLVLASFAPVLVYITVAVEADRLLVLAVCASVVICVLGSVILTSSISSALGRFGRAATRFADGDLNVRMYPPRLEELVELSQSFNTMAIRVQSRLEALRSLSAEQDAILGSMIEGVITVGRDGRIGRLNGAARALLGLEEDQGEGLLFQEVVPHSELQRFVSQSLSAPGSLSRMIGMRDGDEDRTLEAYSSPLVERGGFTAGTLIVFHDITRVQRLENVRRDFVANVSHELRTPITSIKGFVETLQDGAMNEPELLQKFLGIIAKHADRLNAIFSDLLTLAQLEARDEEEVLDMELCSVALAVQGAVEACSLRASERGAAVRVDIPPELAVLAKANLVEQALVNLIDNAIKYSDNQPTVSISAAQRDDFVAISVADSGNGIDPQHLPRLFERFYRVDQGRSRQMGGTGLGLSIVKHIMQVHCGRVEVESVLGEGSTFILFFKAA
jgi:two-component system phosphate regulon sensor histidine kinase PhoR